MSEDQYDVALICGNGHLVNGYWRTETHNNAGFCVDCGSATSPECGECDGDIKGRWLSGMCDDEPFSVPSYCRHCGTPHIWTQKRIQAGEDLFAKLDGLSTEDRDLLNKSIPDLIFETDRTPEAALAIKQAMTKIEKSSRIFVVEFLKSNAVGMANRLLGLEG